MKLILKDGQSEVEVKEISTVSKESDVIILFLKRHADPKFVEKMMDKLSEKTNKEVIILPHIIVDKVYGI